MEKRRPRRKALVSKDPLTSKRDGCLALPSVRDRTCGLSPQAWALQEAGLTAGFTFATCFRCTTQTWSSHPLPGFVGVYLSMETHGAWSC